MQQTGSKGQHWNVLETKFDHTTKRYMQNPESVQENKMQKIIQDFQMVNYT